MNMNTSKGECAAESPTDCDFMAHKFRELGIRCFKESDYIQAYTYLRFSLNCAPQEADVHALIANAALRLGASHLAIYHAEMALEQSPRSLDALIAVAGARMQMNDPKASEIVLALAQYEELGDFRLLQRISLSVSEGEYEMALFDLGEYLQSHRSGLFTGEASQLMRQTFGLFRDLPDQTRFEAFLDGLGILADQAQAAPIESHKSSRTSCVDVIIPVHNGVEHLNACLASIRRWPSAAIRQIIMVDDCSSPETAAWLVEYRDRHRDVSLIRNTENIGFTRSVMAGVRQSNAPYMLFLNSDTQVTSQWLDGMLEAIQAYPQTALVGPLSNNAFYQTIPMQPKEGIVSARNRSPDDISALVRMMTRKVFPRVPFLSGFCLLVDREAFDSAGGLDSECFPYGYWEIQDLCLKLTDLGFNSVIADHVYVHHEGGGSIVSARKEELINIGRSKMYDRYSALRIQIAEAVSAMEPEVLRQSQGIAHIDDIARFLEPPNPNNLGEQQTLGPVTNSCKKEPVASVEGREVCLFVTHCPLGAASDYTLIYLEELKRAGLLVIVCLVVEDLSIPVDGNLMQRADGILLRENGGYDFGAWADILRRFPQVWNADRLYFVNDSVLGPFQSISPVVDGIRKQNAGFFALCESTVGSYHAQSFFFGWAQQNLKSDSLKSFWRHVVNFGSKIDVITNYEHGIAKISDDLPDSSKQILFGFRSIFGCSPSEVSPFNTTHNGWKWLLKAGCPIVKMDLLRDGVAGIDLGGWEIVCASYGADIGAMHRSIEVSRINRLVSGLPYHSDRRHKKLARSAAERRGKLELQMLRAAHSSSPELIEATSATTCARFQPDMSLHLGDGFKTTLHTDLDPRTSVHRILVICPVPPTMYHAGGLRQIDMLHQIKRGNSRIHIELFTSVDIGDCGPLDAVSQVVDRLTIAPYGVLSLTEYFRLSPEHRYFDVIDFQFALAPETIAEYRAIGRKLIFTPMESHIRNEAISRGLSEVARDGLKTSAARTELRICETVDQTICVSETDRVAIAATTDASITAIETGVSDIEFSGDIAPIDPHERAVCYVAYFGSSTNRRALKWYLDQVHPRVLAAVGDYELRIIGRGDVSEILGDHSRGIRHVGEVDRIGPHVKACAIGIAPALSGSGFRGKINQYAHLGVPTVASPLSADGLAYVDGESIMVAEDAEAFADRIIELLRAPDRARTIGAAAAGVCRRVYGWDAKFPAIAEAYDLPPPSAAIRMPSVHAVVPSYMHGPYIEERIRSIFAQQYPHVRVTVIDDHSTDSSDEVIRRLQDEFNFEYIRREANSGSPFSAWKYAAEKTSEDLIWICESDDAAHPLLLANLVRQMTQRRGMAVAYCGSWVVDEQGSRIKSTAPYFAEVFHPTRWRVPFVARGGHELMQYLRFGMVLPNMSSAIIATEVFRKALTSDVTDFHLAGDWLFLGQAMQYGDIAYIPDCLNNFRQHRQTSRSLTRRARSSAEHICVRLRLSELAGANSQETHAAIRYDLRSIGEDPGLAAEVGKELAQLDPRRAKEWEGYLRAHLEAAKSSPEGDEA